VADFGLWSLYIFCKIYFKRTISFKTLAATWFNIVFSGAQPRQLVWIQRFGDGASPRNIVFKRVDAACAREDYIESCRRESFKSYNVNNTESSSYIQWLLKPNFKACAKKSNQKQKEKWYCLYQYIRFWWVHPWEVWGVSCVYMVVFIPVIHFLCYRT
jgi:hypothetical protein